jgi:endonuclease/exonuclease/phosphatase family metal-dependent hydrolase
MTSFSFLTFNSFGIMSWSTRLRLQTLARELNYLELDAICLQEIQSHAAQRIITASLHQYAHVAYVPHLHCPKGGLLTLARHPLVEEQFFLYTEQGRIYTPALMDWILRKGVLITRIDWQGTPIVLMNTHLIANYTANWSQASRAARLQQSQLRQLAALVRSQPEDAIVLVAGDFNVPRGNWLYDQFLEESGLRDTMADDTQPTYRPMPGIPSYYALPIDFIFVREPNLPGFSAKSRLEFSNKVKLIDTRDGYLSDHIAIYTELSWQTTPAQASLSIPPSVPPPAAGVNGSV